MVGRSYVNSLGRRLLRSSTGIEDGEFTPWRLEELVSKEEVDAEVKKKNDGLGIPVTVTLSGTMIRQQVRVKVGLPSDAEGFRRRMTILNAGNELAKLKNPNHQLLGDSDEKVWNGHVKYILGKTVYGMETKNVQGVVVKTPSWELVLHNNQMIFNRIAELMNEGDKVTGGISPPLTVRITGAKLFNSLNSIDHLRSRKVGHNPEPC